MNEIITQTGHSKSMLKVDFSTYLLCFSKATLHKADVLFLDGNPLFYFLN